MYSVVIQDEKKRHMFHSVVFSDTYLLLDEYLPTSRATSYSGDDTLLVARY